ncbi:hypothetical protein NP233_g9013 [Leucocoprinus birnbaumii]|uniref:Nephrocystin 3-like N-terminal domain-containing protein n=1 Tax=Leucocoprinus birnbaumii TaxID=56174 RepID=A0AAD5VLC3_9AGAR|nr:hypothetical protein NP233_g9013 [Leucocoprinus birnbaumii]
MKILYKASSLDAAHDSAANQFTSHIPRTRHAAIIKDLLDWSHHPSPIVTSIWIIGPESDLALLCARRLGSTLVASYFFSKKHGTADPARFFPTIAYQLATRFPAYRETLDNKLSYDPGMVSKSLEVQFRELVLEPFRDLLARGEIVAPQQGPLIVVGNIEECSSNEAREELLRILTQETGKFAIKWLICSQPISVAGGTLAVQRVTAPLTVEDMRSLLASDIEEERRVGQHLTILTAIMLSAEQRDRLLEAHRNFITNPDTNLREVLDLVEDVIPDKDNRDRKAWSTHMGCLCDIWYRREHEGEDVPWPDPPTITVIEESSFNDALTKKKRERDAMRMERRMKMDGDSEGVGPGRKPGQLSEVRESARAGPGRARLELVDKLVLEFKEPTLKANQEKEISIIVYCIGCDKRTVGRSSKRIYAHGAECDALKNEWPSLYAEVQKELRKKANSTAIETGQTQVLPKVRVPKERDAGTEKRQGTVLEHFNKAKISVAQQAYIDLLLFQFFICCAIPFTVLDNHFFRELLAALAMNYVVPDRSTFFVKHLAQETAAERHLVASPRFASLSIHCGIRQTAGKQSTEWDQSHDWFTNLVTGFNIVGLFGSYTPQHYRVFASKTSEGLSPLYLLLGSTSSAAALWNMVTLQAGVAKCCRVVGFGDCIELTAGILQVGIQWFCFSLIFVLYMLYHPSRSKGPILDVGGPSEDEVVSLTAPERNSDWRHSLLCAQVTLAHFIFCGLVTLYLLSTAVPSPAPGGTLSVALQSWATFLGVSSATLAVIMFAPQLIHTYQLGLVGALSIPTICIQIPGAIALVLGIALQPGTNWTSWFTYLISGAMQCILLGICIAWKFRQRRLGIDDFGNPIARRDIPSEGVEQQAGDIGNAGVSADDETTPLIRD